MTDPIPHAAVPAVDPAPAASGTADQASPPALLIGLWSARVGALASGMTVAAACVVLLELESLNSVDPGETFTIDLTLGAGTWVMLVAAVLAAIAVGLSFARDRGLRR